MENNQEIITPYPQKDVAPVIPTPNNQTRPQFLNATCNMQIARLLKRIYAGKYSAFTNFAYSTYGKIVFAQNNPTLATALAPIAQDDLLQLNTLGTFILPFGGNASFSNGQGSPWSARYLNYSPSPTTYLNNAIKNKRQYLALIQVTIAKSTNRELTSALNQIATTTQDHIQTLQSLL